MNKRLLTVCAGCGIAALLIAGGIAVGSSSSSVGVLDLDRVQLEAQAYEKVRIETEKHVSALKARYADEEKALQAKAVDLNKKISQEGKQNAYASEVQKFNKELAEFQKKVQFQSILISRARQAALNQVAPVAQASLKELSQKKDLKIILPRPYVTYFSPTVDVTDDFIKLLDDKDIPVAYPDPAQFTIPATAQQGVAAAKETTSVEKK